ncbi:MAG TPA: hypothetical protein VMH83_15055 [Candidatus Acidoferrum sp.]|nr:hypothetical protein [Candidatus Acidoferrum sp.]
MFVIAAICMAFGFGAGYMLGTLHEAANFTAVIDALQHESERPPQLPPRQLTQAELDQYNNAMSASAAQRQQDATNRNGRL